MRYYKQITKNYITAIGTGSGNTEITEAEYNKIVSIIRDRPQSDDKGYRLKTDLTWEEYDVIPIEPEPADDEADMLEALDILGLTSSFVNNAQTLRVAMDTAGNALTDAQALTCKLIYQQWEKLIGAKATPGQRFLHGDTLFKVRNDVPEHMFRREWEPGVTTASLYEVIDEEHAGTLDDPIPFTQPMEIFKDKYYSQNGKVYLGIRDSGQPLAYNLADLIGHYVQEVTTNG